LDTTRTVCIWGSEPVHSHWNCVDTFDIILKLLKTLRIPAILTNVNWTAALSYAVMQFLPVNIDTGCTRHFLGTLCIRSTTVTWPLKPSYEYCSTLCQSKVKQQASFLRLFSSCYCTQRKYKFSNKNNIQFRKNIRLLLPDFLFFDG
jgi:hypothetical protein